MRLTISARHRIGKNRYSSQLCLTFMCIAELDVQLGITEDGDKVDYVYFNLVCIIKPTDCSQSVKCYSFLLLIVIYANTLVLVKIIS